jgi:hypothetical protein
VTSAPQRVGLLLLQVLGLTGNSKSIASFTIMCDDAYVAKVTVNHQLFDPPEGDVRHVTEHFDLTATLKERIEEPPPFDLDQACAAALERVHGRIGYLHDRARSIVDEWFFAARCRLDHKNWHNTDWLLSPNYPRGPRMELPTYDPVFDEAKFAAMTLRGAKAWAGVDAKELR